MSESTKTQQTAASAFINSLLALAENKNRGALAKLRRGLGKKPGEASEMLPYVVPYLPNDTQRQTHYFLVASLFASHPTESNQGAAMGEAMRQVFEKNNKADSIEKRFTNLLNANAEDLDYHLRQAVSLCESKDVTLDYHQLLKDLGNWTHEAHFVQLDWAKQFWKEAAKPENSTENTSSN